MWIKICGITSAEDAGIAASESPDAIGFVFYDGSPRNVLPEKARDISRLLPKGILRVGVFVHPDWDFIEETACISGLDMIQWHGPAFPEDWFLRIEKLGLPWIDVRKVPPEAKEWSGPLVPFPGATHVLVEQSSAKLPGGNGQSWNYSLAAELSRHVPLILSGGLNETNIGEAIRSVRPFGVDVSSGVESSPGKKDRQKMKRFFEEVRRHGNT
ncbi:phosphoribosylanthranilate isomerase [Leptospirillum ferriphilum]|jgi:phosphoribosylanthranilate isomerase|uniref:N-(5'-phosphoribosyl)anthranilate isomerase n=3 Tax=Leptospirillum TaxID=179 RepID=A0A094W7B6_9BACT|nr:phosphoribosylanthranilate isomerase [Leptospirillum ferriphilum]AFS54143.1 phosphoribosylanthranilate isomerase [Leptospirillum ferriphilum ML-04]EDZ38028.1 MAG: Phosphoribosylanthranilate isomerase [Leptospirillum sp. Group II '5-way CG']KGA93388.1 Phosphoribosylanthranilate isomerase [Leptospirillum ferriphilum]MDA8150706.1 phosphoribosylanthranilate isomerase [Nitrospiraceae bacterium]